MLGFQLFRYFGKLENTSPALIEKGAPIEDLKKAKAYLEREISRRESL